MNLGLQNFLCIVMFHGWIKNFKNMCSFLNIKILIWMVFIKNFLNTQILQFKLIARWRTHGGDADVNSWKWLKKWLGRRDGSVGGNLRYRDIEMIHKGSLMQIKWFQSRMNMSKAGKYLKNNVDPFHWSNSPILSMS